MSQDLGNGASANAQAVGIDTTVPPAAAGGLGRRIDGRVHQWLQRLVRMVASGPGLEVLAGAGLFLFMVAHPSYRNASAGPRLLPISVLGLLPAAVFVAGLWMGRTRWIVTLLLSSFLFYSGIRVVRGNDNLGAEGDRDDAVVMEARGLLGGHPSLGDRTFLGLPATTGPTSILLAAPFVAVSGSNNALSAALFGTLLWSLYRQRGRHGWPLLGVSLAALLFLPAFNWCYWEAGEELLYGWLFVIPAVALVDRVLKDRGSQLAALAAGCLLGLAVGCRVAYAAPALALILLLALNRRMAGAIAAMLGVATGSLTVSAPFIRSMGGRFFADWLTTVWLSDRGPVPARPVVTTLAVVLVAAVCWSLSIHPGVGATAAAFSASLVAGTLLVPWLVYFWLFPVLYWLPAAAGAVLSGRDADAARA